MARRNRSLVALVEPGARDPEDPAADGGPGARVKPAFVDLVVAVVVLPVPVVVVHVGVVQDAAVNHADLAGSVRAGVGERDQEDGATTVLLTERPLLRSGGIVVAVAGNDLRAGRVGRLVELHTGREDAEAVPVLVRVEIGSQTLTRVTADLVSPALPTSAAAAVLATRLPVTGRRADALAARALTIFADGPVGGRSRGALAGLGVAGVVGAGVAVIADDLIPATLSRVADVTLGTRAAVVARLAVGRVDASAVTLTRVVGAGVAVVADDRPVHLYRLTRAREGVAAVIGADVPVVAVDGVSEARPLGTGIVLRARAAVVARVRVEGVRAPVGRVAGVGRADVVVVAVDGIARAGAPAADVTVGAGVAVVADLPIAAAPPLHPGATHIPELATEALPVARLLSDLFDRVLLVGHAVAVVVEALGITRFVDLRLQHLRPVEGRTVRLEHELGPGRAGRVDGRREVDTHELRARGLGAEDRGSDPIAGIIIAVTRRSPAEAGVQLADTVPVVVDVQRVDDGGTLARGRVAGVDRDGVAVVTVDGVLAAAPGVGVAAVDGAEVAVVARAIVGRERATSHSVAGVRGAAEPIVADDELVHARVATCDQDEGVAHVGGAGVLILTEHIRAVREGLTQPLRGASLGGRAIGVVLARGEAGISVLTVSAGADRVRDRGATRDHRATVGIHLEGAVGTVDAGADHLSGLIDTGEREAHLVVIVTGEDQLAALAGRPHLPRGGIGVVARDQATGQDSQHHDTVRGQHAHALHLILLPGASLAPGKTSQPTEQAQPRRPSRSDRRPPLASSPRHPSYCPSACLS